MAGTEMGKPSLGSLPVPFTDQATGLIDTQEQQVTPKASISYLRRRDSARSQTPPEKGPSYQRVEEINIDDEKLFLGCEKGGDRLEPNGLLTWDEIEFWQQDNEYITSGYRAPSRSICKSLKSLFRIHNETVNIYSHLLGGLLFTCLPLLISSQISTRYPDVGLGDIIVFSMFFFGVATCFLLSAAFHTLSNHSETVATQGNQLDYLGIVILMWGSTIPSVYYGFWCNPELQKLYWGVVTLLASLCTVATFSSRFNSPGLRPWRAGMYACLGLWALVFVVHGLVLHGWEAQRRRMGLEWMGVMTALNLVGAAVYVWRIPERWVPMKCDIYGSSHQIFHVMVVFAGLAHMFGLFGAFEYVKGEQNKCVLL
ncbi:uncharacterized protein L3040_001605 [Drepanopeziza brunnea f. sp. 'multigermtubi']|uniref:uncharacterized protein n=1 Tax=Drepanopeziza brunnea f. sp. 'multigermtubi' TaxID=698441 RepID=UPI0023A46D56|nr:hypothetical protein L3040_001605 [Drepanopeziza brunnea f. sp. 'multigermtubi']